MAANTPGIDRPPWSSKPSTDYLPRPSSSRESSYTSLRRRSSQLQTGSLRYAIDEEDDEDSEYDDPFLQTLDSTEDREDQFDPAAWLNGQLDALAPGSSSAASAPLSSLDSFISTLSTKTHVVRTELTDEMEIEMQRASQGVPKIAGEIGSIGRYAGSIKTKLDRLGHPSMTTSREGQRQLETTDTATSLVNGDSSASDPLAHIAELYAVHSQLSSYQSLLRLASSWSTLSADVSSLLSEALLPEASSSNTLANLSSASLRLKEAQNSLNVFGDSQEGKDKAALLFRLIDSFEAAVRPQLDSLIRTLVTKHGRSASGDVPKEELESLKSYETMLSRVGREAAFAEFWKLTRLAALLESWSKARIIEDQLRGSPTVETNVSLSMFLPSFLAGLPALLSYERTYTPMLFPSEPVSALDSLVVTALSQLEPSLKSRVTRLQDYHGKTAILESLKVVRTVREQGREIERILSRTAMVSEAHGDEETTDTATGRQRRASDATSQNGDIVKQSPAQTSPLQRRRSLSRRLSRDHGSQRHSLHLLSDVVTESGAADRLSPTAIRGQGALSYESVPNRESSTSTAQGDFAFPHILYSALTPIWESYASGESQLFDHLWKQEKQTLPTAEHDIHAASGLGDEHFRDVLDQLQRSWTIIADLSEDASARCLEVTRGLSCASLLKTIDSRAAKVLTNSAQEVEVTCKRMWDGLIYSQTPVSSGREWTAFERVTSLIKGLKKLSQRISDLHVVLVNTLKESSLVLPEHDKAPHDVAEKLTKLHGANGAGVNGPAPTRSEMRVLLNSSLFSREEDKRARELLLACAMASSGSSSTISRLGQHVPISSPLPALHLLPLTRKALESVLAPVLHSLLVLPLVPMFTALRHYANLSHWSAAALPGQVANEYQLAMPSFSLGPTETMQTVGEGVLGLVRELESWLADDGVVFGLSVKTAKDTPSDLGTASNVARKERRKSSMLGEAANAQKPSSSEANNPASSPKEHRRRSSLMPMSGPSSFAAPSPSAVRASLAPGDTRNSISPQPLATSPLETTPPLSRRETNEHAGAPQRPQAPPQHKDAARDILPEFLAILLRLLTDQIMTAVLPHLPPASEITSAGWSQLEADMDYLQRSIGALSLDGVQAGLADWKDVVGTARTGPQAIYGFKSIFEEPTRGDGLEQGRLETASLRQMLQSQRRPATPRSDSPAPKSGGSAKQGGGANQSNSSYTVDFNAMNVGMGW